MDFFTAEHLAQMFLVTGVTSTGLYALKLIIFSLSGVDSDTPDGNIDVTGTSSDIAFSFISIQSILAFFMGFGWAGLLLINSFNIKLYLTLIVAICVGLLFMALSAYLSYIMHSLNKNETFDMNECVGSIGKAYSTIKPHSEGQAEIEINSKLTVTSVFNDTDDEISAFQQVKITKYENNTLYIEKN